MKLDFSEFEDIYSGKRTLPEENPFENAFAGLSEIYKEEGTYHHLNEELLDDNNVMYQFCAGQAPVYSKRDISQHIEGLIEYKKYKDCPLQEPFNLGGAL